MEAFTRRGFGLGALAALTAAPAVGTAAPADDAPPGVEFDGRPHQNPKSIGGGTVTATGVVHPPAGYKIVKVFILRHKDGADQKEGYTSYDATVDEAKNPPTWSVKMERLEAGEHWIQARVEFITPDRERKTIDSLEKRRVFVKAK